MVRETDLYAPVKALLESMGYEVKGEVHDCDVVATRNGEPPVVVELKLAFTLDLGPYQPRRNKRQQARLMAEFATRAGDPNTGRIHSAEKSLHLV